jgi:hypothetical protein
MFRPEINLFGHWIGVWVDPKSGLFVVAKGKAAVSAGNGTQVIHHMVTPILYSEASQVQSQVLNSR